MSQLKGSQGEEISSYLWECQPSCFYLGLQLIGWDQPTLGKTDCFTQYIDLNVNVI